jgi:hypothetical protein
MINIIILQMWRPAGYPKLDNQQVVDPEEISSERSFEEHHSHDDTAGTHSSTENSHPQLPAVVHACAERAESDNRGHEEENECSNAHSHDFSRKRGFYSILKLYNNELPCGNNKLK